MPVSLTAMQVDDPQYLADMASHFFYLLAEGAVVPRGFGPGSAANLTPASLVGNGDTGLIGIGQAKAFGIWHHALTAHFTATATLAHAGAAFRNAAHEMYGADSAEYRAVTAAWRAIGPAGAAVRTAWT